MRVLLLGAGAREHALAWKLSQSPRLEALWCAPGNPGTAEVCENVPVSPTDAARLIELARERRVDLVVVGPEAPLVAGVADALTRAGVAVFGPGAEAARIEGSKAFAKEVMRAAGVPTADYRVFESGAEAEAHARRLGRVAVKADGLAAGKGVVVAKSPDEAVAAVRTVSALGEAGRRLVLEELLEGEEASVIALCDGERYVLLPAVQDHKRVGEGDTGPNTGGMGAYAPVPFLDDAGLAEVGRNVIGPTLAELRRRGHPFRGALYAGLMLTAQGPKVIEFNCRFGDPEAQVLMLQVEGDLFPVLEACARGALPADASTLLGPVQGQRTTVGVVLAAEGYPGAPRLGDAIEGLAEASASARVFHAGTAREGDRLVTAGGRVLTVCATAERLEAARERVHEAISRIRFRGMHYRRDIAARALRARPTATIR